MSDQVHTHNQVSPNTTTKAVPVTLNFTLNGVETEFSAPPFGRLLDVLRYQLELTGTKEGCGEGECGACTVMIDGLPVNACLIPFCQIEGAEVVTVEGLAQHGVLHPVQQAFIDHGGAQCGICTPGMVVTAAWMVDSGIPADHIERVMAGNICRCTGYSCIVDSVKAAIEQAAAQDEE